MIPMEGAACVILESEELLRQRGSAPMASWIAGSYLCASRNHSVALPRDMDIEQVTFPSGSGTTIYSWLVGPQTNRGIVILQHGIRADKSSLVERARFLAQAGYAVLLFDFQAHGESIGSRISRLSRGSP